MTDVAGKTTLFARVAIAQGRNAIALWFFAALVFMSAQAKAQEYTLHVGPSGYAPFAMIDRTDSKIRYYGIMFDFLDAFEAENPDIHAKTVLMTRKRVNVKMARGEDIDIMINSPFFVSPAVLEHYKFTDTFFKSEDKVVTLKDQNFTYKTPLDLHGKSVGTIRGYSYGQFDFLIKYGLLKDVRVDTHTQGVGMLHKKRIDAYLGNIHVTPMYIKKLGLDISDFVFSEVSLYKFDIAFAVTKRRPEFYKKLNEFLNRFVSDGSLDRLIKSYIE